MQQCCWVHFIPHILFAVALLCIHQADLLLQVSISSAGTGGGTGPGVHGDPGRKDGLVQDEAQNLETAEDDSRLCAA